MLEQKESYNYDEILEEDLEEITNDDTLLEATQEKEEEEIEEIVEDKQETKKERLEDFDESSLPATVITKGTRIDGSISSDGSLEVMGTINGGVECLGKLTIIGTVKGDCSAAEIFINTPRLNGSIVSEGTIKIAVGTVVVGDVTGESCVIAGAVKGKIDINGPVIIDSTAIVKGDIKAKSIQINNGAVVDGYCSLAYSDVDIDNFFDMEDYN